MIKYVIGVDCALRNTGVSVLDNVGNIVDVFNIKTASGLPDHTSVDEITEKFFDKLDPYLQKHKGQSVSQVYIEHVIFGKTGKSTGRAEATGVLKWNLRQDGHKVYGVVPGSWNSFLANRFDFKYPSRKSKDIKETTLAQLHKHMGYYTRNDNEADALAVSLYGFAHCIERQKLSPTALCRVL